MNTFVLSICISTLEHLLEDCVCPKFFHCPLSVEVRSENIKVVSHAAIYGVLNDLFIRLHRRQLQLEKDRIGSVPSIPLSDTAIRVR